MCFTFFQNCYLEYILFWYISQGMLEMCTEVCVGLYNPLISNFVKFQSADLRLLHIGRQTHDANSSIFANFFFLIYQKWGLQSDRFLVNNSHNFYLSARGMKDIVGHNTIFYVHLWWWLYENCFMKDICFSLNDHCWLTEHIKITIFICQVPWYIIRNLGYNDKQALSLLYCI